MRSCEFTLQVIIITISLELCACVDWRTIYRAMKSADGEMNLKSSCPWVILDEDTIQLVYDHQLCVNLDNIHPNHPTFSTHGRCQPIFAPQPCGMRSAIAFTCVHNTVMSVQVVKRDIDEAVYPPVTPEQTHIIQTENSDPEIEPIVQFENSTETINPSIPMTNKTDLNTESTKTPQEIKQYNSNNVSPFARIYQSYLLNRNAQASTNFQARTPSLSHVQRPFAAMIAAHLHSDLDRT